MASQVDPWLTKRLRAQADIVSGERELHAAVIQAMTDYLDIARAAILGEPLPDSLTAALDLPPRGASFSATPEVMGWLREVYAWQAKLTAAASDQQPPNIDFWPGLSPWRFLVTRLIQPVVAAIWGKRFKQAAKNADLSEEVYRDEYLRTVSDRLQMWPAGAFEQIRAELIEGMEESETIAQQRDRVGRVLNIDALSRELQNKIDAIEERLEQPGLTRDEERELRRQRASLYESRDAEDSLWRWQAARIARTEVMGAYNGGALSGASAWSQDADEELFKQWLATEDDRTRDTHRVADGQVQPLAQPFIVGGFALMNPGDPVGPPQEVIQCRCALLVVEPEDAPDLQLSYSRKLDELPPDQAALSTVIASADERENDMPQSQAFDQRQSAESDGDCIDCETEGLGEQLPTGWRGVLAPMDTKSGDGRLLAPLSSIRTRDLPLVMMGQEALAPGHDGAVTVGAIDRVWEEGGNIMGEGRFDLNSPDGREAARKLHEGFGRWVSVDLDDTVAEEVLIDGDGNPVEIDLDEVWELPDGVSFMTIFSDYRIVGATFVPQPAFNEAVIEPLYGDVAAPVIDEPVEDEAASLIAGAGGPLAPPANWFVDPKLTKATPLTITPDGRVFGHLATWNTCHIGYPGSCVKPPKSRASYSHFEVGDLITKEGTSIPVGKITVGGGHADPRAGLRAAVEHYDLTGAAVAIVRVHEDNFGIAVAGSISPDATEAQIAELRRSPLSGDWRHRDGNLELVAALAVNVPGFPVPRVVTADAGGQPLSLVAAGALPVFRRAVTRQDVARLDMKTLAAEVVAEMRVQEVRRERIDLLVGKVRAGRVASAAARIKGEV